ncbi:MAG: hypothetical protein EBX70_03900, partial [Betaproteobacteria bacterium]|nr:hypothetical protein [Betaproteobacteria bacterium]
MKLPRPIRTLPLSSRPDAMHKDLGIALIGTGGTIAGRASDATTASHYRPASLGVDAILASIPELATRYRIEVQQAFQLGSY